MAFTPEELVFLAGHAIGRIATASAKGVPDVAAVGFSVDDEDILVGGLDVTRTRKYHNTLENPRASFVVDDATLGDPAQPRGVKVTGIVTMEHDARGAVVMRIRPDTIWSWGLNPHAESHLGPIEKRPAHVD
ncbi:MAG: PPOX class F420-dependent oxidoreductase [Acidimicrobiia bacterium]